MPKTLTTPGFWDLHLHGVAGIDFMHAASDEMAFACEKLGQLGTAAFAPTLLTAEPILLREACTRWGAFLDRCAKSRFLKPGAAHPVGLHLEGPFLNPVMAGAHPKAHLKRPSALLADTLVADARGHVAIVTLAPELPGAIALIRRLTAHGIRVQLGHSLADGKTALNAAAAGATGLTHFFNAMRIHHREPSLLTPLRHGLVTAEVITDGDHLHPDFVSWLIAAAPESLYAVSDGCSAIAAPSGARLTLGSLKLRKQGRVAVVAENGIMAGGATPLSHHPCRLHPHLDGNAQLRHLKMYYALQRAFFPKTRKLVSLRNHFDGSTLRFLGSDAS